MAPFKGAIIGLGNIGTYGHLPAYLDNESIRNRAEIVAACDLSEANLKKFQEMVPSARVYLSARKLFEAEELDFVDICAPPYTHMSIILMAAQRNVHILCEKPLAPTLEDVSAIRSIVEEKKIVFQPCHQYYYNPQWQVVKRILEKEEVRNPFYVRFEVFRTCANMGNSNWYPSWRIDPYLSGGGIVADHGTHLLYLASSLLGKPIAVTAKTRRFRTEPYAVEDTATIILEHEKGLSNIFLTWASSHRGFNFSILTPSADVVVKEDKVVFMRNGEVKKVEMSENLVHSSTHENLYPKLMDGFLRRIENNDVDMDFFEEAEMSAKCVFAIYESCCQSRRIEIK